MLLGSGFAGAVLSLSLAIVLDAMFGEPRKAHPLVIFGNWVAFLERKLNGQSQPRSLKITLFLGLVAWSLAVIPPMAIVLSLLNLLATLPSALPLIITQGVFLYVCIGAKSLDQHLAAIEQPLLSGDVASASQACAMIVSRDMQNADEQAVATAAVESGLENGSDAIYAAIFWFAIFGAAGAVFYRLCNTLDAMWGYRSERFEAFGKFAARVDDVLNIVPAQLTALIYLLCGRCGIQKIKSAFSQGWRWKSVAAGPVMAAGAFNLGLKLGGAAVYHGKPSQRADLGEGRAAKAEDISRTRLLLKNALYAWVLLSLVIMVLLPG